MNSLANGVPHPMTPEQSKAQVIDAAIDVSRAIAKPVESANFWRSSCNDQGDAPFRGTVNIAYQPPTDPHAAEIAFNEMKQRLVNAGWSGDGDFTSHGVTLKKGAVNAILSPADASVPVAVIELYGECRDMTTTKATKGDVEPIRLDT